MSMIKFIILFFIGMLLSFFLYCLALYLFEIIALIILDRADKLYLSDYTVNDASPFLLHNMPIFFIFIFSFYWTYFKSSQYQRFQKLKYFNILYNKFCYRPIDYSDRNKFNKFNKFKKRLPKSFFGAYDYPIILSFPSFQIVILGMLFLHPLKTSIYPGYLLPTLSLFLILTILAASCICIGIIVQKILCGGRQKSRSSHDRLHRKSFIED
jgi:hypothetical protein